jgi:transposase
MIWGGAMDQNDTISTDLSAGSDKPRVLTAEAKALIVAESFEPGAKVAEIAARHGINPKRLVTWRKKARDAEAHSGIGGFAPVIVAKAKGRLGAAMTPIELIIGPAKLHIRAGADVMLVAALARALMETAGRG